MMSEFSHEFWMQHAYELAQKAFDLGEVPVGAVLVKDNCIIGEGYNQPIKSCDPSAHAEMIALRDAGEKCKNYRFPNATLYVTIEPCTMCFGALVHARVAQVIYGAKEEKAGVLDSHPILFENNIYNHKLAWQGGCMEQECASLMQTFFKLRRQQKILEKKS